MHTLFVTTTAGREYPDKISHNVAFLQGLHSLLRQKLYSENKTAILTCDPLSYTTDHSKFIHQSRSKNSLVHLRVITIFNSKV